MSPYDEKFYDWIADGSTTSATVILPLLAPLVTARSCVDVGCGIGTWLSAAQQLGASIVGLDGEYVDRSLLRIPTSAFVAHDLTTPLPDLGRFDLAMSLEVAEHLPAQRAASFVAEVAALSDVVLFSAAIPGQGGRHHVNEQPQSYWVALFEAIGYRSFDLIRPRVWDDARVEPWYRQNTLVAVNSHRPGLLAAAEHMVAGSPTIWDITHERMIEQRVRRAQQPPSIRTAGVEFAKAVSRPARRRVAKLRGRIS
jgi:SAM-dependent methyltransferase